MLNNPKNGAQGGQKKPNKKQIAKELERQKLVVQNVIIPILKDSGKSIRDIQNIVKSTIMALDYKFTLQMQEKQRSISESPVSELKLQDELKDSKKLSTEYGVERKLIEALSEEEVGTFKGLLQVTERVIENSIIKETMDRTFDTLKLLGHEDTKKA